MSNKPQPPKTLLITVPAIEGPRKTTGAAGRLLTRLGRRRLARSRTRFSRGCPKTNQPRSICEHSFPMPKAQQQLPQPCEEVHEAFLTHPAVGYHGDLLSKERERVCMYVCVRARALRIHMYMIMRLHVRLAFVPLGVHASAGATRCLQSDAGRRSGGGVGSQHQSSCRCARRQAHSLAHHLWEDTRAKATSI